MSNEETIAEKTDLETVTGEITQAFEEMATEEAIAKETEETTEETTDQEATNDTAAEVVDNRGDEKTEGAEAEVSGDARKEDESSVSSHEKAATATTERAVSSLSNDLLVRAAGVGISLADARTFPSNAELEQFLIPIEAELASAEANTEELPADPLVDLPKLDPDVHDAAAIERDARLMDVIRQERETNQAMAERLQAVEDQQQETLRASEEATAVERNQWFDKQISELGEDFTEALGAGKTTSLQQESSQWANREQIAKLTAVLVSGYQAEGLEPPPVGELFQTAAQTVLRKEYQQINEKKLSGELGNRATQHIERAGGRKAAASQTPEEFAVAELEKLGIPA